MIGVERVALWMRSRRARKRRYNPYIVGAPVFDRQLFFGREAAIRLTLERLASTSVQLSGERRIGKTSFLHHLELGLREPSSDDVRSFPVFVDLEAVKASGFVRSLIEETIEALALSHETLARLRVRRGHGGYAEEDFCRDLREVVGELRARGSGPFRLVLLIDEIDAVGEGSDRALDAWLGPLLQDAPEEVRVVVAGAASRPGGDLERIELQPLAPEDAEALVTQPVVGIYSYEASAVERILEQSGLRPFEIQRCCLYAIHRMLDADRTTVRLADVDATP
jgi:hypothetical protein